MPVLVRAGAIVPTQPDASNTPPSPARTLTLTAFAGASGKFTLYDDAGVGFGYTHAEYTRTAITQVRRGRRARLVIGRARGRLRRILATRAWKVRFLSLARPRLVRIDGKRSRDWSYDPAARTLTVNTGAVRTSRATTITAGP
jgi:alpha-D-xyloside xylohydrolase